MEVEFTEVSKVWHQEHHSQGISYQIPHTADGKPTNKKAIS